MYIYVVKAKQIIAQQDAQIKALNKIITEVKLSYDMTIANLNDQIAQLKRMIYGRKSERFVSELNPLQLNLFNSEGQCDTSKDEEQAQEETTEISAHKRKKTKHKGRTLISKLGHLRVEEIEIPTPQSISGILIGTKIRETLAYTPGEFHIKKEIAKTYKNEKTGSIDSVKFPTHPIPKCEADISLLSYICVSKFVDHLPEYRLQQIFKRDNVVIPPSTMNGWVHRTAELLRPMANHIGKQILSSGYIQMDESTIKVLKSKKDKSHTGYMWVIYSPSLRCVQFIYHQGRDLAANKEILNNYQGKLQTDGYTTYESIDKSRAEIDHYCCNVHARRVYEKALGNDKPRVNWVLSMYQELYEIEREIREHVAKHPELQSAKAHHAYRKEARKSSLIILKQYQEWLDKESQKVLPQSGIGKAMTYTIKRWAKLTQYASEGELEIDTNLIENTIRPLALGRKNYLFAGAPAAAENIGVFYSIFGTCKHMGINVSKYLSWYLTHIGNTTISKIHTLDPWHYKKYLET